MHIDNYNENVSIIINEIKDGKYEEGLINLKLLLENSNTFEEKIDIAGIYAELGLTYDAKNILLNLMDEDKSDQVERFLADIYFSEGDNENAINLMLKIINASPIAEDYALLSEIYFDEGLPEVANRYIDSAIIQDPNIAYFYYQKGIYEYEMGDINLAIEGFKRSIELDSDEDLYYLAIGEALFNNGDNEEANRYFDNVLTKDSENKDALFLKGKLLLALNKAPESIKFLNEALKYQPDSIEVSMVLADAYLLNNNYMNSIIILEQLLEIDEYNLSALKKIANNYLLISDIDSAKAVIYRALDMYPEDESILYLLHQAKVIEDK